jgi:hypothetical protein
MANPHLAIHWPTSLGHSIGFSDANRKTLLYGGLGDYLRSKKRPLPTHTSDYQI